MFSWVVRGVAYVLAAAALIGLLRQTNTVAFEPFFTAFLDQLKGLIDLGIPLDIVQRLMINPVLDFIRSLDWNLPPLQEHWRQFFVLVWLMSASVARNDSLAFASISKLGVGWRLLFALVATLPFCIAAGLLPLGVSAYFMAFASFPAFFALAAGIGGNWRQSATGVILAAGPVAASLFVLDPAKANPAALGALAIWLALSATAFLVHGLMFTGGTWRERLSNGLTLTGADIIAAMGIAFAAVVFLSVP
jgi:hypothetical protein